ncbi:hypothetical protein WA026_009621 [Henosepilachna vigintioctopunctata]|uniref:Uncharacterized protein n=1 Tax=Henosepilachna vigintioctopunctata TaxID=420089 RepID=A0AAW1U7D0_9CUCU
MKRILFVQKNDLNCTADQWHGTAAKAHLNKIASAENRFLRTAIGALWFIRNKQIHRELQWDPILKHLKKKAKKMFEAIEEHENEELRELTSYDPEGRTNVIQRRHRRPKSQSETDN